MLDIFKLTLPTMKECNLNDLPIELADKIKCFLSDNETPVLCILRKVEVGWVTVYAITSSYVIKVVNKIQNNVLLRVHWENQASCIFFSAIKTIGCEFEDDDKVTIVLRGETLDLVDRYSFTDLNLFTKFRNLIFSLKRQSDL
ncbi:MAG: hypothetical protein ACYC2P_13240 [Paludibacteraceae bacterium]